MQSNKNAGPTDQNMALRGIQGKPMGSLASNVPIQAMPNYIVRRNWRVGGSEWERAGQHVIQGDAQRVEIAP
jgi:hypothetical protein